MRPAWAVLLLLAAAPAAAQDREEDLFGDDAESKAADVRPEADPLQIGGLLYLRFNWNFTDSDAIEDHRISVPSFLDVYLDAQPTDRLRAFARGRLEWNPTIGSGGSTSPLGDLAALCGVDEPDEVSVLLDELWLRFDVKRRVFVTVGQQHIRWGATRLWNPVDVLNRRRRDALEPFDVRTGVPLVKLHVPIEPLGWNFYLIGLLDDVDSIDDAGVAARAELVVSTAEIGLSGAWRDGLDPKAGLDLSAGVWDLDVTGEVGVTFRDGEEVVVQASAGVGYEVQYGDDDMFHFGAEYFFNQSGYGAFDAQAIFLEGTTTPTEICDRASDFFSNFLYNGRHYVGGYLLFPGPGSWDDFSVTLSSLANLSDSSALTRLDVSQLVLTRLTIQAFVTVHYGDPGELRLGTDALSIPGFEAPRSVNPVVDLGLYLRVDI